MEKILTKNTGEKKKIESKKNEKDVGRKSEANKNSPSPSLDFHVIIFSYFY